jgi:hypothetical protein
MPHVRRQRRPPSASCARLQPRQLHADAGDPQVGGAVVADRRSREADQDWRQGPNASFLGFQEFNLIRRFTDTITGYHVLPIGNVYSRCSLTWHMPRRARTSALTYSIDSQERGNMRHWAYGSGSMCDR